eukprot:9824891-Ditylum_brightwellii.AAC.1
MSHNDAFGAMSFIEADNPGHGTDGFETTVAGVSSPGISWHDGGSGSNVSSNTVQQKNQSDTSNVVDVTLHTSVTASSPDVSLTKS